MAKQKFYTILQGHETGVYDNWSDCESRVKGYSGALYKSFKSRDEAEEALRDGHFEKNKITEKNVKKNTHNTVDNIKFNSLSVDGACSGNPGIGEYQCVDTATEEVIFSSSTFEDTTNNIMEFFALVEALIYLKNNNIDKFIYSDSVTAIAWVKNKKVQTTLKKTNNNQDTHFMISKFEEILRNEDFNMNKILKWDTKKLGEIKADFGRK